MAGEEPRSRYGRGRRPARGQRAHRQRAVRTRAVQQQQRDHSGPSAESRGKQAGTREPAVSVRLVTSRPLCESS